MTINLAKLSELGACEESTEWIGDKEYPFTPDGVRAALAAGAEPEWLVWLFSEVGRTDAEMWELIGVKVISEDAEVTSGSSVCLVGSPAITVSGGEVRICGKAEPTVTVSGGWVDVCGKAKPVITASGGWVRVFGNTKPAIILSGGWVGVYDDATPTITVSRGRVDVSGDVKPIVRRKDGTEIELTIDTHGQRFCRV